MKKFIAVTVACLTCSGIYAQRAYEGANLGDNWSIGIHAGVTTPLTHSAFFPNMRATWGLGIGKQLTPFFGMGVEAMTSINTTASKTAFDNTNVSLLTSVNLSNLFAGYWGTPRLFEIETVAGLGWLHYAQNGDGDRNSISSKLGLNFNFNLGEAKAWTIGIKPALVYDLNACGERNVGFNANRAAWEITAGLKYHFRCSNGKHHISFAKLYDQAEVDALNEQVNNLRQTNVDQEAELTAANQRNAELEQQLADCKNQGPVIVTDTITSHKKTLESVVTFRQGGVSVVASQTPNVERIATYLKNHEKATVSIKGYASPEGKAEVNARIAQQRADAVKSLLMKRYKIAENRITAEGQGVGNMFEEPDWNRVSICTIHEN
ncbi:OmpA family protein [Bacteroides uniformis]|uniref:OmpA family protein n=1 Tax=Bacteroides uniformis TaxID=820 RepID=UPI00232C107C|nr:OmpA family protein [Bacteroides uniformis]MDC1817298.1 OmpA family protein [Bacteroides uniformis]